MKRISWDERYVVLNIYASSVLVLLAGLASGLILASIFAICFFPMINSFVPVQKMYVISLCFLALALSMAGIFAASVVRNKVKESWEELSVFSYDEPYTFFIFLFGLALAGYASLGMVSMYQVHILSYVWWFPLLIALILAGFVVHMWRVLQEKIISLFFSINPLFLVNEKRFKEQLKLKLSEAKRYGGPFAVLAISIDDKETLLNAYGNRGWQRLNQEVVRFFNMNTRETDVFGQIEDGTIIISLTHTDRYGAEIVAKRVAQQVSERIFMVGKKNVCISLSAGVGLFSEKLTSVDELTLAAILAVNRATEGAGHSIVFNDGEFVKESLYESE